MGTTTLSQANKNGSVGLSAEQQKDIIAEEIQRFIKSYKEKESLTIEEINDQLPQEITDPGVLDYMMQALEVNGETITDLSENKKGEEEEEGFLADPEKVSSDDEDEKPKAEEDSKSNDPVRLYLRKMGSVSLLTREGEVEIAQRIEKGEQTRSTYLC